MQAGSCVPPQQLQPVVFHPNSYNQLYSTPAAATSCIPLQRLFFCRWLNRDDKCCQSSLFPLPRQLCFPINGIAGTLPVNFPKFGRKPLHFQSDRLTTSSIPIIFNLTWPPSPQSPPIWFFFKFTERLPFFSVTSSAFWTACGRLCWNTPGRQQQQANVL